MNSKKLKIVSLFLFTLFLMGCTPKSNQAQIELKDGIKFTTTVTSDQTLLVIEPENPDNKDFETVVMYLANSSGGTTDSKCYTCWKKYYGCIFGGGTNCTDIGKGCNKVCKDEKGVVLAPTSFEAISRKLESGQQ